MCLNSQTYVYFTVFPKLVNLYLFSMCRILILIGYKIMDISRRCIRNFCHIMLLKYLAMLVDFL